MSGATEVLVITSVDELPSALSRVQVSSVCAIDCEGAVNASPPELSLLQIATTAVVIVLDLLQLSHGGEDLSTLLSTGELSTRVWRSTALTKVFWDCRGDLALLRANGVDLLQAGYGQVLDAQLLDVMTRSESDQARLDRLHPVVYRGHVRGKPRLFSSVHRLNSLVGALKEHGLAADPECGEYIAARDAVTADFKKNMRFWMERPLSEHAIAHAAGDAVWTLRLWRALAARATQAQLRALPGATLRFDAVARHMLYAGVEELFAQHSLLPLCVLAAPPAGTMGMRVCERGCQRTLPAALVSKTGHLCEVCGGLAMTKASRKEHAKQEMQAECDSIFRSNDSDY
ncbi:hypothetical protein JKP88DRAFT_250324 [Tribonema minus]|uniref:3'-5' exonuclease domain-containing protein n=1 Tax=Tribonema minus TaxID=303371 RepID=A0A835YQD0_9STRA|nr:hypothetical protein JKP88DRAFT_250324 [Tribonema minus]